VRITDANDWHVAGPEELALKDLIRCKPVGMFIAGILLNATEGAARPAGIAKDRYPWGWPMDEGSGLGDDEMTGSGLDRTTNQQNREAFRALVELIEEARELGYETKVDGAQLYGHVPHVGPEAWLHELYSGLNPAEMDALVERIQRPIPAQYGWWLTQTNGMSLFSGSLDFCGLVRVRSRAIDNRQPFDLFLEGEVQRRVLRAGPEVFFFATTGVGKGSRFYLDTRSGAVHRCARDSATPLWSWSSIAELIRVESRRLSKLFDKTGRCTVEREQIWTTSASS